MAGRDGIAHQDAALCLICGFEGITDNPFPKSFLNGEPVRTRGRSRILRGWVSDFSEDLGLGFCVVLDGKSRAGARHFLWFSFEDNVCLIEQIG
jgi:hypothetical protein